MCYLFAVCRPDTTRGARGPIRTRRSRALPRLRSFRRATGGYTAASWHRRQRSEAIPSAPKRPHSTRASSMSMCRGACVRVCAGAPAPTRFVHLAAASVLDLDLDLMLDLNSVEVLDHDRLARADVDGVGDRRPVVMGSLAALAVPGAVARPFAPPVHDLPAGHTHARWMHTRCEPSVADIGWFWAWGFLPFGRRDR